MVPSLPVMTLSVRISTPVSIIPISWWLIASPIATISVFVLPIYNAICYCNHANEYGQNSNKHINDFAKLVITHVIPLYLTLILLAYCILLALIAMVTVITQVLIALADGRVCALLVAAAWYLLFNIDSTKIIETIHIIGTLHYALIVLRALVSFLVAASRVTFKFILAKVTEHFESLQAEWAWHALTVAAAEVTIPAIVVSLTAQLTFFDCQQLTD